MRFLYLVAFFFISVAVSAQVIKGNVADNFQNPISFVSVQLIEVNSNKIIAFTQTDTAGDFSIKSENFSFPVKVKVSHLSYQSNELIFHSYPQEKLKILLESRTNKIEDVVIEARAYDVIDRNDTLKYNLKSLLNGAELKLKDVVNKLPGLSIDNDGKIRFNGKIVDHLLLDGDEFYGKNHQIANENITAEMIEKIELLKNYKDFSSLKDFENPGQIALNIGLKDEFKEKFKGNIELEGGYDNRYKSHNNLYNFGNKTKFNLIANANNTNYSVISLTDYLNIRQSTGKNIIQDQSKSGFYSITEKDLPSFLFSTDNIHTKDLKNVTLNLTHKINQKERIELISVFNHIKQTENRKSLSVFFDNSDSDLQNTERIKGTSAFSSSLFKYENKINDNSYFKVNSYLFIGDDRQKQSLTSLFISNQDYLMFDNNVKLRGDKLGVNALYKTKFSDKILFDVIVFNDYNFSRTIKDLNSSTVFDWFDYDQNQITQKTKSDIISFGVQGRATAKTSFGELSIQFQSLLDDEKGVNSNPISEYYNFQNRYTKTENTLGVTFNSQIFKQKLRYTAGIDFSNNNHSLGSSFNKSINVVLPNISLSYRLSNQISTSVGYRSSLGGYSALNFLSGNVVENHRTELIANNLIPQKLITDVYNANLSYVNIPKNIFSILSLSHSNGRKNLSKTFENNGFFTKEQYDFLDLQKSISLIYNIEKKFYDVPYGVKFSSFTTKTQMGSFINNQTSENRVIQSTNYFEVKSYYKSSKFNFNLGIEFMNSNSENTQTNSINKNKLEKMSPFMNFNGLAISEKVHWSVYSNYHIFNSSLVSSNEIFDVGFKIIYKYNSKFNFYLHTNNVLNIRDDNTKNSILSHQNFVQETIMNTLSGYVNFGFIFNF